MADQRLNVPALELKQEVAITRGARPLLAQGLARAARRLFARAEPELVHVRLAFSFASMGADLCEEEVECWRLLLAIAGASDPDDPAVEAAKTAALSRISKLDPGDSVIRLRRLLSAIERSDTVEARLARFEQLLSPQSIELIGQEVAARLALAMARLLFRSGDTDGFAKRLAQSLELDPSCPNATATAAGFFAADDPVDEAELLVAALVADPLETGFVAQLGAVALDNGAYKGAERMLALAAESTFENNLKSQNLSIQRSLALWGSGRSAAALDVLDAHMRVLNGLARERVRAANPDLTPVEVVKTVAAMPPSIALLRASIYSERDDKQGYREFISLVMKDFDSMLAEDVPGGDPGRQRDAQQQEVDATRAALFLEAALFAGWHAEDADAMNRFLKAARDRFELSVEAVVRFEAWSAIVQGRVELAIAKLIQLEEEDELAALALSIAYERSGRQSDAARIWLRLARESPGTIIGIWSRNRLEVTIGVRIPRSETAMRIDQVVQEIPPSIDRLLLDRDRAYSLRFEPVKVKVEPFSSLLYRFELVNRSGLPLAIGPEGPILPTAALIPTVTFAGASGARRADWLIVPIDRKLVIQPSESLSMVIDLAYYPVSEITIVEAGTGITLDVRAITNFMSDGTMVVPDRFGEKVTARLLRVDGITPDALYERDSTEAALRMSNIEDLTALVTLVQLAARSSGNAAIDGGGSFRKQVFNLALDQYEQLPPAGRAWLAYAIPTISSVPGYERIVEAIQSDRSHLVQVVMLAKLTFDAQGGAHENETLVRLAASEDPEVAKLARMLQEVWRIALEEEQTATGQLP